MCFGPDGKPDILVEGLVHDECSYQQRGLTRHTSPVSGCLLPGTEVPHR